MFRSGRSLMILFLILCGFGLLVFAGGRSGGGREDGERAFLAACESGPYAAANATDTADAARLCSCILSWHVKESALTGYPLPVAQYRTDAPFQGGGPAAMADAKARRACRAVR